MPHDPVDLALFVVPLAGLVGFVAFRGARAYFREIKRLLAVLDSPDEELERDLEIISAGGWRYR